MHILSPETDNCPSWISGRERMTVENISWSISTKDCCRPRRGLNPRPPGLQSDGASNWATVAESVMVPWRLILYNTPSLDNCLSDLHARRFYRRNYRILWKWTQYFWLPNMAYQVRNKSRCTAFQTSVYVHPAETQINLHLCSLISLGRAPCG